MQALINLTSISKANNKCYEQVEEHKSSVFNLSILQKLNGMAHII